MAHPSKPKPKEKRKLAANRFQRQLNENESSLLDRIGTRGAIWPRQQNANDNLAIRQLYKLPVGELLVDRFAPHASQPVPAFRLALIEVYTKAAQARYLSKPTKSQLRSARTALSLLTRGVAKLDQVSPVGQQGLQLAVTGSPVDDI